MRRPFQLSVNEVFRMKAEHFSFKMKVLASLNLAKQSQKTFFSEKRAVSIITSGKCNSAIEVWLTPILEHYYVLCSRLFDNIVSDPNHKLKALLPPDYDNSRYNLRRQRHFNLPKLCTNRTSNTFIYAMSKQSGL